MKKPIVIVKAADEFKVRLHNCICYRAITVSELSKLLDSKGADIVIIEKLHENELDIARQFISKLVNNKSCKIIFYIEDKDEQITSGIADEFSLEILMTADSLYSEIARTIGIDVKNAIKTDDLDSVNTYNSNTYECDNNADTYVDGEYTINKDNCTDINEDNKGTLNEYTIDDGEEKENTEESVTTIDEGAESKNAANNICEDNTKNVVEAKADIESDIYELEELRNSYEIARKNIELYKEEIADVEKERDNYRDRLNTALKDKESVERQLNDKVGIVNGLESERDEAIRKLTSINDNIEKLENTKAEFKDKISEYEETINRLRSENSKLNGEIAELKNKAEEAELNISSIKSEYERIETDKKRIESKLSSASESINERDSKITELNDNIESLEDKISKLESENVRTRQSVESEFKIKVNELESDLRVMTEKYNNTNDKLLNSVKEHNDLLDKIGGNVDVVKSLGDTNDALIKSNSELKNNIGALEIEKSNLKIENDRQQIEIGGLKDQLRKLEESINILSNNNNSVMAEVRQFEYKGRAKLINVFGHGSFGVTTTAMSIAYRLCRNSNVLVIDMDMSNPSLDAWVKESPYSKDKSIASKNIYRTGIGILIKEGFDQFMRYSEMVKEKEIGKAANIHYINGIYGTFDENEIAITRFDSMLNHLGNEYDYIVVDCGKIGESHTRDTLVKSICNVAYRSIFVVNGHDAIYINSAVTKLNNSEIAKSSIKCILNMCMTSGLSEIAKKKLSGIDYRIMQYEEELMLSSRASFLDKKLTRDRFEAMLSNILEGDM